jgi:hypothetical protein
MGLTASTLELTVWVTTVREIPRVVETVEHCDIPPLSKGGQF